VLALPDRRRGLNFNPKGNAMTTPAATRRGFKTTEFWATTVAPVVLTALTFLYHRDFSGYVQAAAITATGVSTAAYAISRAHLKRPSSLGAVVFDVQALLPAVKQAVADALAAHAALPTAQVTANPTPPTVQVKKAPGKQPTKTVAAPPPTGP
jgi:hypothetical protein